MTANQPYGRKSVFHFECSKYDGGLWDRPNRSTEQPTLSTSNVRKKKGQYVKIRKGNKQFRERILKNNQKERPHMRWLTCLKKQQKKKSAKAETTVKKGRESTGFTALRS